MSANYIYPELEPSPGKRFIIIEADEFFDEPYLSEEGYADHYGNVVWENEIYLPQQEFVYPELMDGPTPRMVAYLMVGLLMAGLMVVWLLSGSVSLELPTQALTNGFGVDDAGAAESEQVETAVSEPAAASVVAAPVPTGLISPVFSPEVQHWAPNIVRWAEQHGIDPDMVATIMQIESCGDPNAVSIAGAQGLFQVMPFHFTAGESMQDPDTNAFRGMNYFVERLAQTGGDVGRAFAGYNGGHVAAGSSWNNWANETQRYYVWTTGLYDEAKAGLNESPTLARWMAAGGASLCRQAANRLGI